MGRLISAGLAFLAFAIPAWALDCTPGSFADCFNAQAAKIKAATRIELQACKAADKLVCTFAGDHFDILATGPVSPAQVAEVWFLPKPGAPLIGVDDPTWILMEMFLPDLADATKSTARMDLINAHERSTARPGAVMMTLRKIQYAWINLPNGQEDAFFVADTNLTEGLLSAATQVVVAAPTLDSSLFAQSMLRNTPPAAQTEPQKPAEPSPVISSPYAAPPPADVIPADPTAKDPSEPTAGPPADFTAVEPPTASTKEIVASLSPSDFKVADPADLFVAPRKFIGKPIEVRHFHCYYADIDDYRCVAPGYDLVAVFTPDLEPAAEKDRLENDCGAMKMFMTAKCERTLRMIVDDFHQDQVDMRDRITLRPKIAIVMPPPILSPPRKRR